MSVVVSTLMRAFSSTITPRLLRRDLTAARLVRKFGQFLLHPLGLGRELPD